MGTLAGNKNISLNNKKIRTKLFANIDTLA